MKCLSNPIILLLFVLIATCSSNAQTSQGHPFQKNNIFRTKRKHQFLRGSNNVLGTDYKAVTQPCTLVRAEIDYANGLHDFAWHCKLDPEDADGNEAIIIALEGIELPENATDDDGNYLVSGESTLFADGIEIFHRNKEDEKIHIPFGGQAQYGHHLKNNKRRKLVITQGTVSFLVVRVIAPDATTTSSLAELSDSIFGTNGDIVNIKSQYAACSYNKFNIIPGVTPSNASVPVINGVVEITIPNNVTRVDAGVVRNEVARAMMRSGFALPGDFDHIMFCLPPGTKTGWTAYAYANDWNSVYNDDVCTYVSIQMHEIGHNLDLAHSGEGTDEYDDKSGTMGYSYESDDGPTMCFNGPKSWQLGWYRDSHATVDPLIIDQWSGELVGVADYLKSAGRSVILKINSGSADDYFVTFNRRSGINAGTKEGGDQVLVALQGNEGTSYSKSYLLAKLDSGESFSIEDFNGSGRTVFIKVNSIVLDASPPRASVEVLAEETVPPTQLPTQLPTKPTTQLTTKLTTQTPSQLPTTAPATNVPLTQLPSQPPTRPPTQLPTRPPSQLPTTAPTTTNTARPTTAAPTSLRPPSPLPNTVTTIQPQSTVQPIAPPTSLRPTITLPITVQLPTQPPMTPSTTIKPTTLSPTRTVTQSPTTARPKTEAPTSLRPTTPLPTTLPTTRPPTQCSPYWVCYFRRRVNAHSQH